MKITVAPGATLTVKGSTENKNWTRVYGVNTKTGSKLDVVGNLDLNLTAVAGTQARGVRSYGNTTITGNLTGTVAGNDDATTGVEVWDGAHLQIKGADSNLKVITEGGRAIGVNNHAASGIPAGTVDFNGVTLTVQNNKVESSATTEGVLSYLSTTNFNGITSIDVTGAKGNTYGVQVECDPGLEKDTWVRFNGAETTIKVKGSGLEVFGLQSSGATGHIALNSANSTIIVNSTNGRAVGLNAQYGGEITTNGLTLNVTSETGKAYGILTESYGGDDNKQMGIVTVNGATDITVKGASAYGVSTLPDENYLPQVDGEGQGIFLNSVQNKIDVTATQGEAVGVLASNKEGTTKPTTELTIKGATIIAKGEGSASSVGVKAEEDGKLTLTGGVTVDAQGNNATGMDIAKSTVTVTGNTKVTSSGVGVKASTDGSVVVGDAAMLETNSMSSEGSTTIGQDGTLKVTGSKDGNSTLGNVAANGGTVELGSGNFAVNELTGAGKKIALNDLSATVNVTKKTDDMIIVATKKANNQNFVNAQEAAEAALKAVTVGNDTGAEKNQLIVEAGDVNNGLTATIDKNGNLSNVKEIENPTLNAYSSAATLTVFQWRHDMSDLTKRMGELRTSPEGIGSWARVYGSKQTYGAQSLTAKNSSIQVGSDVDVGNDWKVGAAFTYTDGKTTYAQGKADNKGYGIAAYGTWMADNGQFVDLIAKYQRMDNDFEVNSMSGSFDNNAFSLSAEYGWHWNLNNVGFLEPQAELTYGKVIGEEFTTSNDVTIDQEDFESLIGRVGVRGGFYFPNNKGVIYARASVLHDFMGEMESTARQGKSMNTIKDDIGGTWFEWGLGANFKVNDSAYTYVDLERTNGGEVVEDFRWTVGARFVW